MNTRVRKALGDRMAGLTTGPVTRLNVVSRVKILCARLLAHGIYSNICNEGTARATSPADFTVSGTNASTPHACHVARSEMRNEHPCTHGFVTNIL